VPILVGAVGRELLIIKTALCRATMCIKKPRQLVFPSRHPSKCLPSTVLLCLLCCELNNAQGGGGIPIVSDLNSGIVNFFNYRYIR
jgi:hypothetical protein